jgi:hypothetical protein
MIRTQVYFTEDLMKNIKLRARLAGKPEAEVIRDLVSEGLKAYAKEGEMTRETTGKSLLRLAKVGARGPADTSERIDEYLYGKIDK